MIDWHNEIVATLIWLIQAWILTTAGSIALAVVLKRYTLTGAHIGRLCSIALAPIPVWKRWGIPSLLLFVILMDVRLSVLLTFFYNSVYNALQLLDKDAFILAIWVFGIILLLGVIVDMADYYIREMLKLQWRTHLNTFFLNQWLDDRSYYYLSFHTQGVDNPDQRIEHDIALFCDKTIFFFQRMTRSFVSIVAYTVILWNLSAPLDLGFISIPHGLVFIAYAYVFIATLAAIYWGNPLVALNFLAEKFSANYRYLLVRIKEYAQSIAFYRGENSEKESLQKSFTQLIQCNVTIIQQTMKLLGINLFANQLASIIGMLVQAPRFFAREISLGDIVQTGQGFTHVQNALSFFRIFYDEFTAYRATLERLHGFFLTLTQLKRTPLSLHVNYQDRFYVTALTLHKPNGELLMRTLNEELKPSDALLIKGASGSGKTTFLRALAGLWPYASGEITLPEPQKALFLPQRLYLPHGSLRRALCYPHCEAAFSTDTIEAILAQCHLAHLIDHLDTVDDWAQMLSLGEQQRLAFGQALLHKPMILFLDEATSALDEAMEHAMYTHIRAQLPKAILISIGHRSTLEQYHTKIIYLS